MNDVQEAERKLFRPTILEIYNEIAKMKNEYEEISQNGEEKYTASDMKFLCLQIMARLETTEEVNPKE